jgi:hypothetical protein
MLAIKPMRRRMTPSVIIADSLSRLMAVQRVLPPQGSRSDGS